ncbi:MAG: hypothetical protein AAF517_02915 [Planctomycetota bacterium]
MSGPKHGERHRPIVYIRGYAGKQAEVEDTVATPHMGFNLGSTKMRQAWTGEIDVHIFESPLVRLMKDHGYVDAYRNGERFPAEGEEIPAASVWIYRYYDNTSQAIGSGLRPEIEDHARGLRRFIERIQTAVGAEGDPEFSVYLVAHSMGGLICRAYLQNPEIDGLPDRSFGDWRDKGVAKVFTIATPHGGIEFRRGLSWAESIRDFFDANNSGNFGPRRMREFLGLQENDRLSSLNGQFPPDRFFCMVGTDATDYGVAWGLSKASVGPMSDGLVTIRNATVDGAPRAFTHRSHSGHFGIVNDETSYQNMVRFLFGDVRVDGRLLIEELSLPPKVQRAHEEGKRVRASYHIEAILRVRGKRWDLHRRLVTEGSAIFREFDELLRVDRVPGLDRPRHPVLFSTYLSRGAVVNPHRKSLGFSLDLHVRVPDYYVEKRFWPDDHFEGGYIYREKLNFEVTPPRSEGDGWKLRYGSDERTPNRVTRAVEPVEAANDDGAIRYRIPVNSAANARPGIRAVLELECRSCDSDEVTP